MKSSKTRCNLTEISGQIFTAFTVTSFRGDLYVSGGIILESEAALCNLHKYNPGCDEWRQLASMEAGRFGHCAVVLEDLVYANVSVNLAINKFNNSYKEVTFFITFLLA